MTDTIQPFYRTSGRAWWTLRLMRLHFALAGMALLVGALGLLVFVYSDLDNINLSAGLRITNPGDIYEQSTQVRLALAVMLALASLIPFRAVANLGQRRHGGIGLARLTGLMLLAGFPASFVVWRMVATLPESPGEMTTTQQVIDDVSWAVLALAVLLFLQSALAVWYLVWLSLPGVRNEWTAADSPSNPLLNGLRMIGIGLWVLVMIGFGVALGVMTDWLYEISVPHPDPGELLYATSFDAFNDEWDLFPGRDEAQIASTSQIELAALGGDANPLSGNVLWIKYGSGISGQIVWSTLDRKFGDLDLRVTAQQVSGPLEESQYGVAFRYRDDVNFYVFRITGDGYYSLVKVKDEIQEDISVMGFSEAIRRDKAANEIRVVARGDEFRFFVNGVPMPLCLKGSNRESMWNPLEPGTCVAGGKLTYVYRDSAFRQGRVALVTGTIFGSDVEVAFDDLVVVGPEPDVMEEP